MRSGRDILSVTATLAVVASPVLVLGDLVLGLHGLSIGAFLLILVFVLVNLRGTGPTARVFLVLSLAAALLFGLQGAGAEDFARVANRSAYLPALIIVLTLLRFAARSSPMIRDAGEFAVRQPPNRRFVLLASGGHIFGILLNIGGYLLLLDTAMAGRIAKGTPDRIRDIQLRRITTAAMRGFAATILWSPLGLSLNLLLTLVPDVSLVHYLPYGLGVTLSYLVLGWIFDRIQNPMPSPGTIVQRGGKPSALVGLLAVLVAISASAALLEYLTRLPLRAAILIVVPAFALGWSILGAGAGQGPVRALQDLALRTARGFPGSVNEICIMGAAGFLGIVAVDLIPHAVIDGIVRGAGLEKGQLAAALAIIVIGTSLIGINPLIIAAVLVTSVVQTEAEIQPILLILAIQVGWSLSLLLSPVTSTVIVTAGATGQSAGTVGLRWNGPFVGTALALAVAGFLLFGN
ncbi:hypothetical protein [Mesobacterium pallidum]|uniref:hypothetical protein n=1 Tax=Mesobacterium pallidum TaxID=2872037 RepID=UPI001EE18E2D|nr:hypothetical protein [Mesobacterium pallidum]